MPTCCVPNCKNTSRHSNLTFYRFPISTCKLEQRNNWITAVNRKSNDGSSWFPKQHDRICSAHFIGGKKSEEQASPSYIPSIFPPAYQRKKVHESGALKNRNFLEPLREAIDPKVDQEVACKIEYSDTKVEPAEPLTNEEDIKIYVGTTNIDCPNSNIHDCTYTHLDLYSFFKELPHSTMLDPQTSIANNFPTDFRISPSLSMAAPTTITGVMNSSINNSKGVEINSKSGTATSQFCREGSFLSSQHIAVICRVCLCHDGVLNLQENQYDNVNYFDILEDVVSSKLKQENPMLICKGCEDSLIKTYMFKKKLQKSELFLEKLNEQNKQSSKRKIILSVHDCKDLMTIPIQSSPSMPVAKNPKMITKFYMCKGNKSENVTKLMEIDKTTASSLIRNKTNDKRVFLGPTGTLSKSRNIIRRAIQLAMMGCTERAKRLTQNLTIPNRLNNLLRAKKYSYPMNCKTCGEVLELEKDYKKHVTLTNHFHTPFPCDHCAKVFPSERSLTSHKKGLLQTSRLCDKCGASFTTTDSFQRHIKNIHNRVEKYKCSICSKSHIDMNHLKRHRRLVHPGVRNPKTVVCEFCGLKQASNRYKQHINDVHLKIRPLKCGICDKKFLTHSQLKKHKSMHSLETFACGFCSVRYKHLEKFDTHRQQHHPALSIDANVTTEYSLSCCTFCETVCPNKQALSVHLKEHRIVCIYCDVFSFKSEEELGDHHKKLHKNISEWMCRYCNKLFDDRKILYSHLSIHKHKAYKCKQCPKSYDSSWKLKRHKQFHDGVLNYSLNYECHFCSKKFKDYKSRVIHERIHTGERPYKCDICGSGYMSSSSRNRHHKTHFID